MSESTTDLWRLLTRRWSNLGREVREALVLRWQLMLAELRADAGRCCRIAAVMLVATIVGMVSLPLLLVAAAEVLDGTWGASRSAWLAILGTMGLATAATLTLASWRAARCRLIALHRTREELHEDLLLLGEWLGRESQRTTDADQNDCLDHASAQLEQNPSGGHKSSQTPS